MNPTQNAQTTFRTALFVGVIALTSGCASILGPKDPAEPATGEATSGESSSSSSSAAGAGAAAAPTLPVKYVLPEPVPFVFKDGKGKVVTTYGKQREIYLHATLPASVRALLAEHTIGCARDSMNLSLEIRMPDDSTVALTDVYTWDPEISATPTERDLDADATELAIKLEGEYGGPMLSALTKHAPTMVTAAHNIVVGVECVAADVLAASGSGGMATVVLGMGTLTLK